MIVLIGLTILLGLIGAVVVVITAADVRSAWAWTAVTDWGDFTVNVPLNVAIIAGIAIFVLSILWRREMDAFRPPWIGLVTRRISKESTAFDSAASAFYLLVGNTYVYVRPEGVTMSGRIGVRATIESLRFADSTLAEHASRLGLAYIRTRLLSVGDTVVATGAITADAEGRLSLQAKPPGRWNGALVPAASVRLLGRGPRDRRHRHALKAAG